jgi:hypothetical protein
MLPPFELVWTIFFLANHPPGFCLWSSSANTALDGPVQLVGGCQLGLDGTKMMPESSDAPEAIRVNVQRTSAAGWLLSSFDTSILGTSKLRRDEQDVVEYDCDDCPEDELWEVAGRLGIVGSGGDTLFSERFRARLMRLSGGGGLARGRYESCSDQIVLKLGPI